MTDGVSRTLVGGEVTPLDTPCPKCGGHRMFRVEILRLSDDGVTRVGETDACVPCDTRPAA